MKKTQEMLLKELDEVNSQLISFMKEYTGSSFWMTKEYKELSKKERSLKYEIEKVNHNVWEGEDWITNLEMPDAETEEGARSAFVEMVKDMPGVEIEFDKKNRVKVIRVRSLTKIYVYAIHAYWYSLETGTKKIQGLWDEEIEVPITKPMCSVKLTRTFDAYRNDEDYISYKVRHSELVEEV
jgi:hypothetical protein